MKRIMATTILVMILVFSIHAQVPETMSFQGIATDNAGNLLPNGMYNMDFRIFDVPTGGGPLWHELQNVTVTDGVFNIILGDVTPIALPFENQYWLSVEIDGNGQLSPRYQLASAPYSLSARSVPDGSITQNKLDPALVNAGGDLDGNYPNPIVTGLQNRNLSAAAPSAGEVLKWDGSQWKPAADVGGGGSLWTQAGSDIYYNTGNVGIGNNSPAYPCDITGALNINTAKAGIAMYVDGDEALWYNGSYFSWGWDGQWNFFGDFVGIRTILPYAVLHALNNNYTGALGSDMGSRYSATQNLATAVYGQSLDNPADITFGVYGNSFAPSSTHCIGVFGEGGDATNNSYGIYGTGYGNGNYSIALYAHDLGTASANYAAYFIGDAHVAGTFSKSAGSFRIDHPLDPANKYLQHSFVESPDMMNVYNGNIITDNSGTAVVELPMYFEVLNIDYRYQLTVIGSFAQAIVAQKIKNNQFVIKTDKPNIEVSWQVTGIRNDEYARTHRIIPEVYKQGVEKGKYQHPELFGKSELEALPVSNQQIR